jgi:hypothetical protein
VSAVEPGSVHDITAAREHVLGAPYAAAAAGLPTLADSGYEGAGIGVFTPVEQPADGHHLDIDTRTYNTLLRSLRCLGERGFALLKERWRTLWVPRIEPPGMTWGFSIGAQTPLGCGRIRIRGFATGLSDLHPTPRCPCSAPPLERLQGSEDPGASLAEQVRFLIRDRDSSSPVSLTHRPHRALNQASPLRALPDPIDADITVTRRDRAGGLLHEYSQVA